MIKKFESIDTLILNYPDAPTDIQYIECSGILRREDKSENSGNIRSKEVFGRFQLPEVGKIFNLVAEPFDKNLSTDQTTRVVSTSKVIKVEKDENDIIHFWTLNSKYSLEIHPTFKVQ